MADTQEAIHLAPRLEVHPPPVDDRAATKDETDALEFA
jgi:hypothetical protein